MSVPRWREMLPIRNRSARQVSETVPAETANSRNLAQKQSPTEALREFSTGLRSASRNPLSSPCVTDIPSSVALRKRAPELSSVLSSVLLRTDELRSVELSTASPKSVLRTLVLRTPVPSTRVPSTRVLRTPVLRTEVSAYPTASPKSTLAGVFETMKRAARSRKSQRIGERLATQVQSAYPRPRNSVPLTVS